MISFNVYFSILQYLPILPRNWTVVTDKKTLVNKMWHFLVSLGIKTFMHVEQGDTSL